MQVVIGAIAVLLDISLDDFGCHFIAHGAGKVAIFSELATPQLTRDLRVFSKDGSST